MASKPTQRSLKYLRGNGWTACIVEKFLPARGDMKFPRRIDAFGFGDILACSPADGTRPGRIVLVQTTDHSSFSKHKEKILALAELHTWKASGGMVALHGWGKRGARGEQKRWKLREELL